MDAEMLKAENELRQKMQEICARWPHLGITLILKATRETMEYEPVKVAQVGKAS